MGGLHQGVALLLRPVHLAAVAAFLKGRIPFGAIAQVNMQVLEETALTPVTCVEDVYEADRAARLLAERAISALQK